ncbi:MAG: hypothetical protein AB7F75_01770 [Planctomycetota bacterium]
MSGSPNCDSCGIPLRGEDLFTARRRGSFFFCLPCGVKRERQSTLILGACILVGVAILVMAHLSLSWRLQALEEKLGSQESGTRP